MRSHPICLALFIGSVAASCASDGSGDRATPETAAETRGSEVPATNLPTTDPPVTDPPTIATTAATASATVAPEPAGADLVPLFAAYVAGFEELNAAYGRALPAAQTVGDQVDARLELMTGWSALLSELADGVGPAAEQPGGGELASFVGAHVALSELVDAFVTEVEPDRDDIVAELDAILAEDDGEGPAPDLSETRYRQLLDPVGPTLEAWWAACLDMRRALGDGVPDDLPCGEPDEAPEMVDPSQAPTSDFSDAMPLPAGEHRLDYLATPLVLSYDETVVLRSSPEAVEIARSTDGPSIRVLTTGLIAHPGEIGAVLIEEFPAPDQDLSGWLSLLPVAVDGSGVGTIGGAEAEYWDLTSIAEIEIVIAGGGDEFVDDLRLDPAESTRIWLVRDPAAPLLVNERWLGESDRSVHATDLELLLDGIGFD